MPIYEYLCHSCGKKFDVLQKFSDEPLTVHEECGGKVDRLISAPAFHFKGSGWYVNDYAKGGTSKPSETKTESKSDSGGETKSETKTESKPAATESKPAASPSPSTDSK